MAWARRHHLRAGPRGVASGVVLREPDPPSVGSGHRRAATALADAFARQPGCEVRVADTLDYGSRVFRRAYTQSYIDLSEHAPAIWRLLYDRTNVRDPEWVEVANRMSGLVERPGGSHLKPLITRFAPDAIVCTHFLPVELLLRLSRQGRLAQPIYCVVTDFLAHCFWAMPAIDGYFVASALTRERVYRAGRPAPVVHDQTVILVDDGLATGMTMRAAIVAVRAQRPARLVVAVPVAARESLAALQPLVDALIWVIAPKPFYAIGLWYENFAQTTDADVRALLERARSALHPAQP